jgi:hypothetical protein
MHRRALAEIANYDGMEGSVESGGTGTPLSCIVRGPPGRAVPAATRPLRRLAA